MCKVHTSNISKHNLQSIVKEIQSYGKDTKDFIQKLSQIEEIPEDSLLVILGVNS